MQFWPRKRAKAAIARVRYWVKESKVKPLGFIGYKIGMTHIQATDNRPKALTKGETIALPVSMVECPPMKVMGIVFYKNSADGLKKIGQVMAENPDKDLRRTIQLPKKAKKKIEDYNSFDDLRLLVYSSAKEIATGAKKPKIIELVLGGAKNDKLNYVKEKLGKEISVNEVIEKGNIVDVHGITKGKGYQGTVKRFGVPVRQHKAEKTKRGIGTLGSWTPKRVEFTVPQGGKMGFHQRTEFNKQVLKVGTKGEEISPKGGITSYGEVKNNYVFLKGSIIGPKKRAVMMTMAIRPDPRAVKDAPEITYVSVKP
jgi:large subunit ribosomal protein L3